VAVDRGDRWKGELLQFGQDPLHQSIERDERGPVGQFGDICPCCKRAVPGAGDDQTPGYRVALQLIEDTQQLEPDTAR